MNAPQCFVDIRTIFGAGLDPRLDMSAEVMAEASKLAKKMGTKNINSLVYNLYNLLKTKNSPRAGIEAAAKRRNLKLQTKRNLENFQWVTDKFKHKEWEGIEALLTGSLKSKEGSRNSVDALQHSLGSHYQDGFLSDILSLGNKHIKIITSHSMDKDISRALASLSDPTITFNGASECMDIAKVMHKWMETARHDANMYGAFIEELPGYIIRQNHNELRMKQAGEVKWVDDIYARLDWDKTADGVYSQKSEAERRAFLAEVFRNLTMGRLEQHKRGDPLQHYGSGRIGSTANKMSHERVLHFADPDQWFEYNKLYGDGFLMEGYVNGLRSMANDTALMKVMGPSPEAGLHRIKESVRSAMHKSGNANGIHKMETWNGRIENTFREVSGLVNTVDSPTLAWIGSTVRGLQNIIKLGGAVLSSLTDIGAMGAEASYQGGSFLGTMLRSVMDIVHMGGTKAEQFRILSECGVVMDGFLGDIAARLGSDGTPGRLAELQRKFFKLNLLTQWTDRCRRSFGMGMAHVSALEKHLTFDKLSVEKQRLLSQYGIKDWEWNEAIRFGKTSTVGGKEYLTPAAIAALDDAKIESILKAQGETPDAYRIETYRQDLTERYRNMFSDRTNQAVLMPDARTKGMMHQGTQRGSVGGELMRFVTQFKQFPMAYLRQVVGREIYGRMGQKGWQVSSTMSLARLMLVMTGLGYVSMSLKQLAKGQTIRDPRDPETWLAAMLQGGGAGILGDFLLGKTSRFGNTLSATLNGPTMGTLEDIYKIYGNIKEGEGDNLARNLVNFGLNNLPFRGLFYASEPFNYLLGYQLQEAVNPGAWRRRVKRLYKDTGQKYWYGKPLGI